MVKKKKTFNISKSNPENPQERGPSGAGQLRPQPVPWRARPDRALRALRLGAAGPSQIPIGCACEGGGTPRPRVILGENNTASEKDMFRFLGFWVLKYLPLFPQGSKDAPWEETRRAERPWGTARP